MARRLNFERSLTPSVTYERQRSCHDHGHEEAAEFLGSSGTLHPERTDAEGTRNKRTKNDSSNNSSDESAHARHAASPAAFATPTGKGTGATEPATPTNNSLAMFNFKQQQQDQQLLLPLPKGKMPSLPVSLTAVRARNDTRSRSNNIADKSHNNSTNSSSRNSADSSDGGSGNSSRSATSKASTLPLLASGSSVTSRTPASPSGSTDLVSSARGSSLHVPTGANTRLPPSSPSMNKQSTGYEEELVQRRLPAEVALRPSSPATLRQYALPLRTHPQLQLQQAFGAVQEEEYDQQNQQQGFEEQPSGTATRTYPGLDVYGSHQLAQVTPLTTKPPAPQATSPLPVSSTAAAMTSYAPQHSHMYHQLHHQQCQHYPTHSSASMHYDLQQHTPLPPTHFPAAWPAEEPLQHLHTIDEIAASEIQDILYKLHLQHISLLAQLRQQEEAHRQHHWPLSSSSTRHDRPGPTLSFGMQPAASTSDADVECALRILNMTQELVCAVLSSSHTFTFDQGKDEH
ncbi:hypothetical protein PTSG_02026 [Salpingoeca rosetta]|uniref:Uncharacterized protein n=1 Tax=Salpingoeca rosetta (strain ATCC 50818 / BSB-021) TaxID=946362 RepID=F2TZN3_SALR5|nr:uncharacterized protein PTSG_02026 [Salpingoeca rosetta]EGD79057.1 hypothetical protein PTSG_02026 [Salpingoeca rosetta]|eukprot:XP_004998013.1 hypothetical protein PTSG_02026 [Salpingoeca rosetta]